MLLVLEMQMDYPWVSQNLQPIPVRKRAVHFIRELVKKAKDNVPEKENINVIL